MKLKWIGLSLAASLIASGCAHHREQMGQTPPSAQAAPAMATPAPQTTRSQLSGGKTQFTPSEQATKDAAYLTPLPVEFKEKSAYPPSSLHFKLPWEGTHTISNGYGFQSRSWTHQTIGNEASANDFFAIDVSMPVGVTVIAAEKGRILTSQDRSDQDSYGKYIVIDHGDGIHTIYAHLSKLEFGVVDHGQPEINVEQGQKIAESGQSGGQASPHLHFGIHKDSHISQSGCDVGGSAVAPEPISGYYGLRRGHALTSDNVMKK